LEAPDCGDGPIVMNGRTADVLRRQAAGTWLVVIDDPFGGGAA
jgi:ketosteroid isomerase-like protein